MRTVGLIAGSLLTAGVVQEQQLRGGYATYVSKKVVTFDYHFYWFENGRFIHTEHGCTSNEFGAGTYQLRGDSLWLHFDGPTALRSIVMPNSTHETPGTVSVKVLSMTTGQPLAGAQVSTWSLLLPHPVITATGVANLRPLPAIDTQVFVNAPGYEPVTVRLQPNHWHYTARLAPARPQGHYEAGTTQLKLLKPGTGKHLHWRDPEKDWEDELELLTPQKTAERLADAEQLCTAPP